MASSMRHQCYSLITAHQWPSIADRLRKSPTPHALFIDWTPHGVGPCAPRPHAPLTWRPTPPTTTSSTTSVIATYWLKSGLVWAHSSSCASVRDAETRHAVQASVISCAENESLEEPALGIATRRRYAYGSRRQSMLDIPEPVTNGS